MSLVIYSERTGRLRRYITDQILTDVQLLEKFPALPGESHEFFDELPGDISDLQDALNLITGKTPADDRYVLVNPAGGVTGAILADPDAGDSVDGLTLVEHTDADVGWRQMTNGTFQRAIRLINDDIRRAEAEIDLLNGPGWLEDRQDEGLNPGQINQLRRSEISDVDDRIVVLEAERADRLGPRT